MMGKKDIGIAIKKQITILMVRNLKYQAIKKKKRISPSK